MMAFLPHIINLTVYLIVISMHDIVCTQHGCLLDSNKIICHYIIMKVITYVYLLFLSHCHTHVVNVLPTSTSPYSVYHCFVSLLLPPIELHMAHLRIPDRTKSFIYVHCVQVHCRLQVIALILGYLHTLAHVAVSMAVTNL